MPSLDSRRVEVTVAIVYIARIYSLEIPCSLELSGFCV